MDHHPLCCKHSPSPSFDPKLFFMLPDLRPFQVVGFVWGYICQQFAQTIYILGAGVCLACVVSKGVIFGIIRLSLEPVSIQLVKPSD